MKWLKEFGDFINRGNVMDLAVGIIIGAAFTAIVNSLVNDLIMPLIGIIIGGVDFTSLAVQVGSATLTYGNFIQAIFNFVIIAFAVFLLIKAVNNFYEKKAAAPPPPTPPTDETVLLREIRDILAAQSGRTVIKP
ncbi:MAG: large-conductance mechanosensitive channel protein MscL [Caldilineaceae bacterium]|nr:large-conductance mechanosensitive channel protein MscL [Caldilineaceae bacterium]